MKVLTLCRASPLGPAAEWLERRRTDRTQRRGWGAGVEWHCPPAEKGATELGYRFRVVREEDLTPVFTNNAQLLADALRADREPVLQTTQRSIREAVSATPGITVAALTSQP